MGKDWDDMYGHSGFEYRASMQGKSMMDEMNEGIKRRQMQKTNQDFMKQKQIENAMQLYDRLKDIDPKEAEKYLEYAQSLMKPEMEKERHK